MPTGQTITIVGNLTSDPELRFTSAGTAVATLSVAVNERKRTESGEWVDGDTSFFRVHCWRESADHVAESLTKGARVIVHGLMRQRRYEAKDGTKRDSWEIQADAIGPDLRYATAKVNKISRNLGPVPDDPWASTSGPQDSDVPPDEPPF